MSDRDGGGGDRRGSGARRGKGLDEPSRLVLLAHGSRDPEWRAMFERLADGLALELGPERVRLAYMELAEPSLRDVIREASAEGWDRLVVLPLFIAPGRHVKVDVPRLVIEARAAAPGLDIVLRPPVGEDPRLQGVLRRLALESMGVTEDRRAGARSPRERPGTRAPRA